MAAREVSAFPQPPATHRAERIKGFSGERATFTAVEPETPSSFQRSA